MIFLEITKYDSSSDSGTGSKTIKLAQQKSYEPMEVFTEMGKLSKERQFVESVDTIIKLNVDPTKGDQMIRGTCILPEGTGKSVKVCVFASSEVHEDLIAVGADIIGNDQTLLDIANGKIEFDKLLCSQEMIQDLKAYARVLGPRGLMPNTKSGTLVKRDQIVEQVKQSKQGLVEFRVNSDAFIKNKIGMRSFDEKALHANFDALMMALIDKKPESVKGRYFLKAMIKTTMGPTLRLNLEHYNQIVSQQLNL